MTDISGAFDADAMASQLLAILRRNPIRREDIDAAVSLVLPVFRGTDGDHHWTSIRNLFIKVERLDICVIDQLLSGSYINPIMHTMVYGLVIFVQVLAESGDHRVHINVLYTAFGLTKLDNGPREMPQWSSILREVIYIYYRILPPNTYLICVPTPLCMHIYIGGSSLSSPPRA